MFRKKLLRELCFISFLSLLLLSGFLFNGCENSMQSNLTETGIKGRIYGMYGVPYQGLKITAGEKSVNTDKYGTFIVSGVADPYDLVVLDTLSKNCLFIPKHDNTTSNKLALSYFSSYQPMLYADININYPDSMNHYKKKCFFTDFNDKTFYSDPWDSSGFLQIKMAPETQCIGSLLVLAYTFVNGHAVSYDKYFIKNNISVNPGNNLTFDISASEFISIPQQYTYRINLTPPSGLNLDYIFSSFSLTNRLVGNYSVNMLIDTFRSPAFDIVVPSAPGISIYPMIFFTSIGVNGVSSSAGYISGNSSFTAPEVPLLVSPGNNEYVDINTELVFNQGLNHVDSKYYKLYVTEQDGVGGLNRQFTVYLEKERIKISDLNNLGLGSLHGSAFTWNVEVISGVDLNEGISDGVSNLTRMRSSSLNRKFIVNQK